MFSISVRSYKHNYLEFRKNLRSLTYSKYNFLKELDIHQDNFGLFDGVWGGTGTIIESISPSTGNVIARVQQSTQGEISNVIDKVCEAQLSWSSLPPPARGSVIRQVGDELRRYKSPLGKLISLEMDDTALLLFLKTQEVIHEFQTKHVDERMWVDLTEKETIFIAETAVPYKLAKHFITEEEERLLKKAIEERTEKLYLPYCKINELECAKIKEKERDEEIVKERDEEKEKERDEVKAKDREEEKEKELNEENMKENNELGSSHASKVLRECFVSKQLTEHIAAQCPQRLAETIAKTAAVEKVRISEDIIKLAADNISASERQNEKIITTLAEIQRQMSKMNKRMKRIEVNQKKLADKVEENQNQVFEYVDKELNVMWNELSEQVGNNVSNDNEGHVLNKQACFNSTQMPSKNINKSDVIQIIKDELRKLNRTNDSNNGSILDVSREITETLKSELSQKGSILRRYYKLTKKPF